MEPNKNIQLKLFSPSDLESPPPSIEFPLPHMHKEAFLSLLLEGKITQALELRRNSAPKDVTNLVQKAYKHYFEMFFDINKVEYLFNATRIPLGIDSEYLTKLIMNWYGLSLPKHHPSLEALQIGDYDAVIQILISRPDQGEYFPDEYILSPLHKNVKDYDSLTDKLMVANRSISDLDSTIIKLLYDRFAQNNDLKSIADLYIGCFNPLSINARSLLKNYITWCLSDPTEQSIYALQQLDLYFNEDCATLLKTKENKDYVSGIIDNAREKLAQIGVKSQELKKDLLKKNF